MSKENQMTISKRIIIEELEEQAHVERVEDVIFWALDFYAKNKPEFTQGKIIASYLVSRIKEDEENIRAKSN